MSDQYVGEIRMFAGNYAPQDWHFCDGSLLSISENELLYSLIGTTYGGDGVNTFAVPDMRGRIPVHTTASPPGYPLGLKAGTENVTLTQTQLPAHKHVPKANSVAAETTSSSPAGHFWGVSAGITNYSSGAPNVAMSPQAVSPSGFGLPHNNMMPSLAVSFIIALYGNYPMQD